MNIEIASQFLLSGTILDMRSYGNGHINDTFLVSYRDGDVSEQFILQKINKYVFTDPAGLMDNIVAVTAYLKKKIIEAGGDPLRETLNPIPTKDGRFYYVDQDGEYWRAYLFIKDGVCYDTVEKKEDFYESAVAFGNFQRLLAEFPAHQLIESIPGFHNTKARFATFRNAVAADVVGRAAKVQEEIDFLLQREDVACCFSDLLERKEIPLRVTHNDTKLNNIMMDPHTGKGLCVLDLDTVMPGVVMNDFGDAIRFGASTAAEDEPDLSKVSCDLELFEIYLDGFMKGCGGALTEKEIELLPMGAKVLTYEQGMRFLTDYLQGDVYYKTSRPGQNLDRCRTQLKLVKDMEDKWDAIQRIMEKYR